MVAAAVWRGTVHFCAVRLLGDIRVGRLVWVDAKEDPADLQLCLGHHAEILRVQSRDSGLGVDIPQGHGAAAAQQHDAHGGQLDSGGHDRPSSPLAPDQRRMVWD